MCAEKFLLSPGQLIVLDVDGLGQGQHRQTDSDGNKKVLGVAN